MKAYRKQLTIWVFGFVFSLLFIWGVSAVFLGSIRPKVWDSAVGRFIDVPGLTYRHRSEGWADTCPGLHGMSRESAEVFFSPGPKFLFWGDSYAEAVQVSPEERAVNVYNALAGQGKPRGVTIADSGLTVADYYFYIPRYEALTDNVVAHIFLLDGLRGIMPGSHLDCHSQFLADPWRFEEHLCEPSELAQRYGPMINRSRLDFLHGLYRSLRDYSFRFSVGNLTQRRPVIRPEKEELSPERMESAWRFLLAELARETRARLVFIYAPLSPALSRGNIRYENEEDKAKKALFARLCREAGADFIDLSADFLSLYEKDGTLTMGFFNTPQGAGHFNASGQAVVARGLLRYFSGASK